MAQTHPAVPPPPYSHFTDVLPDYDFEKAVEDFNALSSEEKAKFTIGIAQAASNNDAMEHFKEAANAAANAADQLDMLFVSTIARLMNIEDTESFVDELKTIQEHYRSIVKDSHTLAIDIAHYAESFDAVVVQFCADQTLTVERRKTKIDEFIEKGNEIEQSAELMKQRFEVIKNVFAAFVGSFSTWAKDREEADQEKIKKLYEEIDFIDSSINTADAALVIIGAGLGATLGIAGLLVVLFPAAAPWIVFYGLILCGLEVSSITAAAIAKCQLLNEKHEKENQIRDLEDEISKIKAARTQLEENGQADLLVFTTNVGAISNVWVNVRNDAQEIRQWLQDGADVTDQPAYMKASLEKTVTLYASMAQYLKDYANGVIDTVQKFEA